MNRLWCGLLGLVAAGCGDGGLPVSGTVTLDNKPLAAAVLAIEPEAGSGTTGAGAVLEIRDGAFQAGGDRKLTPGKYVFRVSPLAPGSGENLKTAPPQFKTWETKVELKSGGGPVKLDVPGK